MKATTESTTYRIDKDAKRLAYEIFDSVGLKPSQAINLFLRQVAIHHKIPFEIVAKIPNQASIDAISEPIEGRKSYVSFDDLLADVNE